MFIGVWFYFIIWRFVIEIFYYVFFKVSIVCDVYYRFNECCILIYKDDYENDFVIDICILIF